MVGYIPVVKFLMLSVTKLKRANEITIMDHKERVRETDRRNVYAIRGQQSEHARSVTPLSSSAGPDSEFLSFECLFQWGLSIVPTVV